jgi:hypothetical protein
VRVQSTRTRHVLHPILQDVRQGPAHLRRRPKRPGVVATCPYRATVTQNPVHSLRHPHRQPLAPAGERLGVGRLDDEVHVIGLNAELEHPERLAGRRRKRAPHRLRNPIGSQRRKTGNGTHGYVEWRTRVVRRTSSDGAPCGALGPVAAPRLGVAHPTAEDEGEL